MVTIPPLYQGRDPVSFREMLALYERYCDREINLSPATIEACLTIQQQVITSGSLRVQMAMIPRGTG